MRKPIGSTLGQHWASMLWQAMTKTGKGYRTPSVKRDGKGERRADKIGIPSWLRRYRNRYS